MFKDKPIKIELFTGNKKNIDAITAVLQKTDHEIEVNPVRIDNETELEKSLSEEAVDVFLIDNSSIKQSLKSLISKITLHFSHSLILVLTKDNPTKALTTDQVEKLPLSIINSEHFPFVFNAILNAHEHASKYKNEVKTWQYRNLFDNSLDSILNLDENLAIVEANNSALELLEYNIDKIKSLNLWDLFYDKNGLSNFKKRFEVNQHIVNKEELFRDSNGEAIWVIVNITKIYSEKLGTYGHQLIIHDITTDYKANALERSIDKFELTSRFLRGMAHEVRNPLTNINLAINQLEDVLKEDEENQVFLNIIQRSSSRINELITELIKTTKPFTLHFKEYSVKKLLDQTIDLAMDRIKLRGIEIVRAYQHEQKEDILSIDVSKLQVALLNLMINAVEAMEENIGTLKIYTRKTKHDFIIEIIDNGSGIEEAQIQQLFTPFYSKKKNGVGLGLTTTQNIINGHRGSIEVESKKGKGTAFKVYLPLNQ